MPDGSSPVESRCVCRAEGNWVLGVDPLLGALSPSLSQDAPRAPVSLYLPVGRCGLSVVVSGVRYCGAAHAHWADCDVDGRGSEWVCAWQSDVCCFPRPTVELQLQHPEYKYTV
ncbi:hypothetical protein PBY51_018334 [Eleginops maclovinus]|uniref:Uncharacterized protein n=1 Tax=Eleginops maclovinus TaxID=56733 RepID=A0AAN8AY12_ELEMC|nr:hypothetical protein PBY51_018334 [Eleginops maclovinus]